jgi:hypothetical protein
MRSGLFLHKNKWVSLLLLHVISVLGEWSEWSEWQERVHNFEYRERVCENTTTCEGSHISLIMSDAVTLLNDVALGLVHGRIIVARDMDSHEDCMNFDPHEINVRAFTYNPDHRRCSAMSGSIAMSKLSEQKSQIKGNIFFYENGVNESDAYAFQSKQWSIIECLNECLHANHCFAVTFSLSKRVFLFFNVSYTMIQSDDYISWFKARGEKTQLYRNPKFLHQPIEFLPNLELHSAYAKWAETTPTGCLDACYLDLKCGAMTFDLTKFLCALYKYGFTVNHSTQPTISWFKITDVPLWNSDEYRNLTMELFSQSEDSEENIRSDIPIWTGAKDPKPSKGIQMMVEQQLLLSTSTLLFILLLVF